MNLKSLISKSLLGIALITGTYYNSQGCSPFINEKEDVSFGICVGGYNRFKTNSAFYGIDLSIFSQHDSGSQFYGLSLSAVDENNGEIYGGKLAIYNTTKEGGKIAGLELGIVNSAENMRSQHPTINGFQVGLFNTVDSKSNVLQMGIINLKDEDTTPKLDKISFGLGYNIANKNGVDK